MDGSDFEFIKEVGNDIYNKYFLLNQDGINLYNGIKDYYEENNDFPSDAIENIKDFVSHNGDEDGSLIQKIDCIIEQDNAFNLLNYILFPYADEEEAEAELTKESQSIESQPLSQVIIVDDDDVECEDDSNSPNYIFTSKIQNVVNIFCFSEDIAYLICKFNGWDQSRIQSYCLPLSQSKGNSKLFNDLHIQIGSEMTPNRNSSLQVKTCGKGKCPLCHKNEDLYQLYCGHKICTKCLTSEIESSLKKGELPFCRENNCGSEILINHENFPQFYEKYQENLFLDRVSHNLLGIVPCPNPNCRYYAELRNNYHNLNCDAICCSYCNTVICSKCLKYAHVPLRDCSLIHKFNEEIPAKMNQLHSDQIKWVERELPLGQLRCKNKNEVKSALEENVKKAKIEMADVKAKQQLAKFNKKENDCQEEISKIKKTMKQMIKSGKKQKELIPLVNRIMQKRQEIDGVEIEISEFKKSLEEDQNKSSIAVKLTVDNNNEFMELLNSAKDYANGLKLFEEKTNNDAYNIASNSCKNSEIVGLITVSCDRCHKIMKYKGLNHLTCSCGESKCLLCGQKWDESHCQNLCCPKYMIQLKPCNKSKCGIDFNDKQDKKFYAQPMPISQKINFIRFNNYFASHRRQLEIRDEMIEEFNNRQDKKTDKIVISPLDEDLCLFNRMKRFFSSQMEEQKAIDHTNDLINTCIFAQSIIAFSFPTSYLYFVDGKDESAVRLEISALKIKRSLGNLREMMSSPSRFQTQDILNLSSNLKLLIRELIETEYDLKYSDL